MFPHDFKAAFRAETATCLHDCREYDREILAGLRKIYDMDLAFIARTGGDGPVLETVDRDPAKPLYPMLDGKEDRLSALLAPGLARGEAGSRLCVPIVMPGGEGYGMLCALSRTDRPDLTARDVAVFAFSADMVGRNRAAGEIRRHNGSERLRTAIEATEFHFVVQPVFTMPGQTVCGHELLTRFPKDLGMPARVFAQARACGLVTALEAAIARASRDVLDGLPKAQFLSVNFSASSVETLDFETLFRPGDRTRIVIEITEHEPVPNYTRLKAKVKALRRLGFRIAVDDLGAGHSSLRHVLALGPDFIKLDRSLVSQLETRQDKRSLVAALRAFAALQDCRIIAEGVETEAELREVRRLGVDMVQGYYLGRPMPVQASSSASQ